MVTREQLTTVLDCGRPFLQADGADIELVQLHHQSATVRIIGACSSCPVAFDLSVEAALREALPELESLRVIR